MNLIRFEKHTSASGWYLLRNFRQYDYQKIKITLMNMLNNLKLIRPEFNFTFNIKNSDSVYNGGFSHRLDKYVIELQIGKYLNKVELEVPKLVNDNCFMLNGSLYVPILFLERAPIDRVGSKSDKKNKILLNILTQPIIFDWNGKKVKISKKSDLDISVFFKALFYDEAYEDFLNEFYETFGRPMSNNRELTYKECKTKTIEAFGIFGQERFLDLQVDEFIDKFILLDYFKETFHDYYGYSDIKNIVRVIYQFYKEDKVIDMADIRNRRIVMAEYLLQPIFDWYNKILYNFTESNYKEFLIPTLKENSIISEGFREIMHGEQLFNITLPYITPIVHKISQAIVIISGKVPKKWTSNHPSAMGVLCPISVSAQDMGQNLVATLETEVNLYGRIKSKTMEYTKISIPKITPLGVMSSKNQVLQKKGDFLVNTDTGEITEINQTEEAISLENELTAIEESEVQEVPTQIENDINLGEEDDYFK